jgi:CheY-like chemotaxis protein
MPGTSHVTVISAAAFEAVNIAEMRRQKVLLKAGALQLKILGGDAATAHIPVIALSANAMQRDIEKGLSAGFFRYPTKPLVVNEFMEALEVALKFSAVQAAYAKTAPGL